MQLLTFNNQDLAAEAIANLIIARIKAFAPTRQRKFVLCLPTGSSPIGMYKELARRCRLGEISFEYVTTFNLDEYVGLGPTHPQSYHAFMEKAFDLPPSNQNLLYGLAPDLEAECADYEAKLQAVGGIDLLIAGIGENGHLALNEPGSSLVGVTRVVQLNEETRAVNARFFDGDMSKVPTHAVTMGIGSIMTAREIVLIAQGEKKAQAMRDCFQGGVSYMYPASILQLHPSVSLYADTPATSLLSPRTLKALSPPQIPILKASLSPISSISSPSMEVYTPAAPVGRRTRANGGRLQVHTEDEEDIEMIVPPLAKLPPLVIRLNRRGGALRVVTGSGA